METRCSGVDGVLDEERRSLELGEGLTRCGALDDADLVLGWPGGVVGGHDGDSEVVVQIKLNGLGLPGDKCVVRKTH